MMQANDLGRAMTLWVDAGGCVTIREKGRRVDGSLPVFSTDTREQAERLQVRHCRLARDGSALYFLNQTPHDVADLGAVSDLFRATYAVDPPKAAALRDPEVRRAALDIIDKIDEARRMRGSGASAQSRSD